jgi:Ca2+-binding EF-hand superfamily protein
VRADSFPLMPALFTSLDKNRDGRLQRDEFPRLNDVPPHLVIAVEFGSDSSPYAPREERVSRSETPTQPRLRLVSVASELDGSGQEVVAQPGRLTFPVAGILLTLYTNDTVATDDFAARAKQVLDMYDANKDGYLEKSEVPESLQAQFARFEAVDDDEDGKAYPAEIEAFLAQQQVGLRAQIHAKASDREDVLFAALDADHDERLDSREVEGASQRLGLLDRNGDGLITPDELPEVMVIGLARGSLENANALFTPPPVIVRSPDAKAPRWFTAMDANGDGAISRREFLGPPEKFAELDKDGNGLLELGEVVIHANP